MNLLRDHFKDNLSEQLELAMDYAAITSVDDNAEAKQSTRKFGNKTLFISLDAKVEQLAQIQAPERAIALYRSLLEKFEAAQIEHANLSITYAKTATTIANTNVRQGKVMLWIPNPRKRDHAPRLFLVPKFAGSFYTSVVQTISKGGDIDHHKLGSLIIEHAGGGVSIYAKLRQAVSPETYEEVLALLADHVIGCCANEGDAL
jgi:hypothetical protein